MFGGISSSLLERRKNELLFAYLCASDHPPDIPFKIAAVERLLNEKKLRQEGLCRDALLLLVEDLSGLRPRTRVLELIESTHLLNEVNGVYRLCDPVIMPGAKPFRRSRKDGDPDTRPVMEWTLKKNSTRSFP